MAIFEFNDGANVKITATPHQDWAFAGWQGDLSGDTNPATIIMDANKSIIAMAEEIVVPPVKRILTLATSGGIDVIAEEVIDPIPLPLPEPGVYGWKVSNIDPGADWDSPQNIDYSVVKNGDSILLEGIYNGSWVVGGRSGVSFYGRNFIIQNGSNRGLDLQNSNDLFFGGENNDRNNFKILEFDDKHFRIDQCSDIIIKALHIETGAFGGQTDCIYAQHTDDITVKNCSLIINNPAGGHNDCFQGFRIGGEVLLEGNTCLQNNDKDTDNQGIYITTPSRDKRGTYSFLNNYSGGVNSAGGRSKIKNCNTVRILPSLGGKPVPVEIRGNEIVSDGYNYVYIDGGITDYNSDIVTSNNVSKTRFGIEGIWINGIRGDKL